MAGLDQRLPEEQQREWALAQQQYQDLIGNPALPPPSGYPKGPRSITPAPQLYRQSNVNPSRQGRATAQPETVVYSTSQKGARGLPVQKVMQIDVSPNPSDWRYFGDTAIPPERLMRPGMATTPTDAQEVTPSAPMPPPMSFLERMAAQKRYSPTEAREGQAAVLKAQGYSPANLDFAVADGSQPANLFYKETIGEDGKPRTRYTIPGESAIGGGPGFAEFQGQRKGGGSFSVISGRTPKEQAEIDARVAGINQLIDAQRIEQGKPTQAEEARLNALGNLVSRFATPPDNMTPQQMELWKLQQAQIAGMLAQQAEQDKAQQANTEAQRKAELEQYRWRREQAVREQQTAGTEYDRGITRRQAQQDLELKRQMYLSPKVDPIQREKMLTDAVNEYVGEPITPGEAPVFHGKAFADRYQIDLYNPEQAETGVPYYHEETGDFMVVGPQGEMVPLRPETVLAWKMAKGI